MVKIGRKLRNEEFQLIIVKNTWELHTFLEGRKPITSKWVFSIKQKANEKVDKYKSRWWQEDFLKLMVLILVTYLYL
jgi:hypothetical protein